MSSNIGMVFGSEQGIFNRCPRANNPELRKSTQRRGRAGRTDPRDFGENAPSQRGGGNYFCALRREEPGLESLHFNSPFIIIEILCIL